MMRKGSYLAALAAGLILATGSAQAAYTSISHNLINGTADTFFNSGTGAFSVHSVNANLVSLFDPGPTTLIGTISNAVFDLNTTFNQILVTQDGPRAQFVGGSLSLSFNFDPDGIGGAPATPHIISGPITGMLFGVTSTGPTTGRLDGEGRWTATNVNLPGSGVWPALNFSSIDSLTLVFNQSLAGWMFNSNLTGRGETQYSLFPNDSSTPEPATLGLLAIGAAAMLRRRR
jgi:hypothetical protein